MAPLLALGLGLTSGALTLSEISGDTSCPIYNTVLSIDISASHGIWSYNPVKSSEVNQSEIEGSFYI